ncbi:hypothetical protein ACHQM5_030658 [Ranunculus cassubicifolius]
MNRGNKACRNFMRGSCHYGDQCKFSHSFNIQQTQQQQNQFKGAFENKWTRTSSPLANQQSQQGAATATHACTDPEACKRIIVEDFQKERPLWNLTCYAHFKHLPCDIVGDISYEELRAVAYDDAKKGLNLVSVVERERNILNSKLVEFDNFQRSPYKTSSSNAVNPSPFPSSNNTAPPAVVSSFSQLGMSVNQGSNTSTPSNNIFGQPITQTTPPNPSFGQPASQTPPPNPSFGQQQNPFSILSQKTPSQTNTSNFPIFPSQTNNNSFVQQPQSPHPVFPSQTPASQGLFGINQHQTQTHGNIPIVTGNNIPTPTTIPSPSISSTMGTTQYNGDMAIWYKESWEPGEIPEDAPPDSVCF